MKNQQKNNKVKLDWEIKSDKVWLIDAETKEFKLLSRKDAIEMAQNLAMNLVEVSMKDNFSVCKIMDYGKHKFKQTKDRAKNLKAVSITKELRFSVNIEDHDYNVKLKHMEEFIKHGHKVKICILTKRRIANNKDILLNLFKRVENDTINFAKLHGSMDISNMQIIGVFTNLKTK